MGIGWAKGSLNAAWQRQIVCGGKRSGSRADANLRRSEKNIWKTCGKLKWGLKHKQGQEFLCGPDKTGPCDRWPHKALCSRGKHWLPYLALLYKCQMTQQFSAFYATHLQIQRYRPSFCPLSCKQVLLNVKWAQRSCMFGRCRIASVTGTAQTCPLNRCFALAAPPLPNFPGDFSEDTAEWMNSYPSSMFVPRRCGKRKTKYCLFFSSSSLISLKDLLMWGFSQPWVSCSARGI